MANSIVEVLKFDCEKHSKFFSYQSCFPIDTRPYKDILERECLDYSDVLRIAREYLTNYTWNLMHFDNINAHYDEATGPYAYFLEYTLKPEAQE